MKNLILFGLFSLTTVFAQDFWVPTAGPGSGPLYAIVCMPNNDIFASGGYVDKSTDGGDSWVRVDSTGDLWDLVQNSQGQLIAGANGEGVRISSDGCATWTQTSLQENKVVKSLYIDSSDGIFAGTDGDGLFYSADGSSWQNLGLPGGNDQAIIQNSLGEIFLGIWGSGVFRSGDFGVNWVHCDSGLTGVNVRDLAMNSAGILFAGTTDGGVFRSSDDGVSWEAVNNGLTAPYPFDLAINSQGHLFAATYYGVFRTMDNGDNWEDISSGIGAVFVRSIAIAHDGIAYAGTEGGMVYKSSSSTTSIDEPSDVVPEAFTLAQNYPNPFNGGTRIGFQLTESGIVRLELFDVTGRRVATMLDGVLSAGQHHVMLRSSEFVSGIYFYRLENHAGEAITRKMTILK